MVIIIYSYYNYDALINLDHIYEIRYLKTNSFF